jgi:hypothetical protein
VIAAQLLSRRRWSFLIPCHQHDSWCVASAETESFCRLQTMHGKARTAVLLCGWPQERSVLS